MDAKQFLSATRTQELIDEIKSRLSGKANTADLGSLASLDEVAESNLASALATKINGKADTSSLGDLATLDEVAESNLASALATKINGKADSATTINGYGITDAYTKTEVDSAIDAAIGAVFKPGGSKTASELVSSLLVAANLGKVYNMSEAFTTTADFVEGAGKTYPVGTNVVIVDVGTAQSASYKFDVLSGFVDLSHYWSDSTLTEISQSDLADMWDDTPTP